MEPVITSIQDIAKEAREQFHWVIKAKKDGEGDEIGFWQNKKQEPGNWIMRLITTAHHQGDMIANDQSFAYLVASLDRIIKLPLDSKETQYLAAGDTWDHDEKDSQLLDWLGSHIIRSQYVSETMQRPGRHYNIFSLIGAGQSREKADVYRLVLNALYVEQANRASGFILGQ